MKNFEGCSCCGSTILLTSSLSHLTDLLAGNGTKILLPSIRGIMEYLWYEEETESTNIKINDPS